MVETMIRTYLQCLIFQIRLPLFYTFFSVTTFHVHIYDYKNGLLCIGYNLFGLIYYMYIFMTITMGCSMLDTASSV